MKRGKMLIPENVASPIETDIWEAENKSVTEFYPVYRTNEGAWEHICYNNVPFHQTPIYWYFTRMAAETRCTLFKEMVEQVNYL